MCWVLCFPNVRGSQQLYEADAVCVLILQMYKLRLTKS